MSQSPNASSSENHLSALALFHWIYAAMLVVAAIVMVVHAADLIYRASVEQQQLSEPLPGAKEAMTLYGVVVGLIVLVTLLLAAIVAQTGRWLRSYKQYNICLVVAGVECLLFPLGTILGVFTVIVLLQTRTRDLFQVADAVSHKAD